MIINKYNKNEADTHKHTYIHTLVKIMVSMNHLLWAFNIPHINDTHTFALGSELLFWGKKLLSLNILNETFVLSSKVTPCY